MYTWRVVVCVLLTIRARASVRVRDTYNQFLGIPYAEVDHNDPFGAAKPYPHFDTPYSVYNDPPICPQVPVTRKDNELPQGNIHCLHLNIYVPTNTSANSTLPVMVYIHGGSYVEGNGNVGTYSPTFLVRNNVILVTVNYRLGPYGFLCLPQLGYSNQGLKDIVLALKWIKDRINSFGGDEDNILLFGNSSGSQCAELILLHNEDNVFNKVILQSGQSVSPYFNTAPADQDYVTKLAKKLGIDVENLEIKDVMDQLSSINTDLLINIARFDKFSPCVDDIFIKKAPRNGNLDGKAIMVGTVSEEMLCFYLGEKLSYLNTMREDLNKCFVNLPEDAFERVKHFYFKVDNKENAVKFGSDLAFNYPAERSVLFYLANNAVVYRYVFEYDGGQNFVKVKYNITDAGTAHGDELGYLFSLKILGDVNNDEDCHVINTVTRLWTNFAKYGNPTPGGCVVSQPRWPQFERRSEYYMRIGSSLSVAQRPYLHRMLFWDRFYHLYGKYSTGFHFGEDKMYPMCYQGHLCDGSFNGFSVIEL